MTNFIFSANPTLTLVCRPDSAPAVFSLRTAADLTGVAPALLRHYCEHGLLGEARAGNEPTFDDDALYAVRRIEHCRRQHAVNLRALPLICELWRELEHLQAELRFHRGA